MESSVHSGNMSACRICLDAKSGNSFKFEIESEWTQLFQYCVGLTITQGNAPQVLCTTCAGKLKDYARFKSQCLQSDMMWKQLPYGVKTEKIFAPEEMPESHDDFDRLDGLSDFSYAVEVKAESVVVALEYADLKPGGDNHAPSTVTASPLKLPNTLKRKASKTVTSREKKPKLNTPKASKSKQKSKSRIKRESTVKEESEDTYKEPKFDRRRRTDRPRVIPVKITPYTDEEKIERRVIAKNTDVRKYLDSVGKTHEEVMGEKEFIQKYYIQLPSETSKKGKWQPRFACRKCSKKYKGKKPLVTHTKVCSGDKELNVILNHELKSLLYGPPLPVAKFTYCGICPFSSEDSDSVNEHWKEHITSNLLECKQCTYTGRDMADMVAHRYKHHPLQERHWIRCPTCSWCTMQVNRLEYHYRSLHLNKKGGLCNHCDKEFVDYRSWICHQIKHNVDRFVCDHCGKNFMHRHDIEYHLNIVFGTKKYTCETCGRGFKRMSNLRLHIQTRHAEPENLKCDHCDRTFKNKHSLANHLRDPNQLKCFCDVCGKELYKNNLKNHMMQHTGERPFKCEVCNAGYITERLLKIHMRAHLRAETKIKPYACQICKRTYTTVKSLRSHEKTHILTRSVKCPYCERTFYEMKRMRYHCKVKHHIAIPKDEPM